MSCHISAPIMADSDLEVPASQPVATAGAPYDVVAEINRVVEMGAVTAKGNAKVSGISKTSLQQMAGHLKLVKTLNKGALIDAIIAKVAKKAELVEVNVAKAVQQGEGNFRKDKHSFPRLCNILMCNADALARCAILATRATLQDKQINEKQPIFVESVQLFNDSGHHSGGMVDGAEAWPDLEEANIDPERINSGVMLPIDAWKMWNEIKKEFAIAEKMWTASGQHDSSRFLHFCHTGNKLNVLYLHLWLQKAGNPTLQQYCKEGQEYEFGFDSALGLSSVSGQSDRKRGAAAIEGIAEAAKKKAVAAQQMTDSYTNLERHKTRAVLWDQITKLEDRIDMLEHRSDYDPASLSDRHLRALDELDHCMAERKKMSDADAAEVLGSITTTPTNLSL
jgi:hypothetical protein